MPRSLRVTVNREGHQEVDARTKRFATDGPFVLAVENQGEGCHVHLSVGGELALGGDLQDDNPYVAASETLEVPVEVATDLRPATGAVTVTTGYGRNEATVDVRVNGDEPAAAESADETAAAAPEHRDVRDAHGDAGAADGGSLSLFAGLAAVTDRASAVLDSSGSTAQDGERSGRSAPSRPAPPSPSELGPGTLLLLGLAVLALGAALLASASFAGPVVTGAVGLVVVTVVGAALYLLLH